MTFLSGSGHCQVAQVAMKDKLDMGPNSEISLYIIMQLPWPNLFPQCSHDGTYTASRGQMVIVRKACSATRSTDRRVSLHTETSFIMALMRSSK